MKKILALILALVMVLSLVACGEKAPADDGAADDGAAVTEGFVWNGQKEVWSILPTTAAEGLIVINDAMAEVMKAEGFTHVYKDAEGNPANQVTFVEDAIAAGNVGALMIAAMDPAMLQEVVEMATSKGIAVAMLGVTPAYPIAGYVATSYELTGMQAVKAAEDWAAKRVAEGGNVPTNADGKYEVALDTYYDIVDGVYRSNAMVGTVNESETLALVSETSAYGQSAVKAFDNATDVLGAHPDCRIFVVYEPEQAMGTADAIADYASVNGLDLADFCVIPCYNQDSTFKADYWGAAQADASSSAVKGYSTYGDDTGKGTGECLAKILLGVCKVGSYEWTFGEPFFDTVGATNIYGYEYFWQQGDENPAAKYRTEG